MLKKNKKIVPVVLLGGWLTSSLAYDDLRKQFVQTGREVIFYDYALKRKISHSDQTNSKEIEALKEVIDNLGFEKINLVTHSKGAIPAMDFALNNPDRVNGIVLMSPAGLTEVSFLYLATSFLMNSFWDLIRTIPNQKESGRAWKAAWIALWDVKRYPWHYLREAYLLSKVTLPIGKVQKLGVKVAIIASEGDMVFTKTELIKKAKEHGIPASNFRVVAGKKYRHNNPIITPEEYTRVSEELFKGFDSA